MRGDGVGDVSPVADGHDTDDARNRKLAMPVRIIKADKVSPPPEPIGDAGGEPTPEKACRAESDSTDEANVTQGGTHAKIRATVTDTMARWLPKTAIHVP